MNTFSKAGKADLLNLFRRKKEIFTTTRYEDMGMVQVFPRIVEVSKDPVDLEREYLGCITNAYGRQNHYKIFIWAVELPLIEIILVPHENEGRLIDLINRFAVGPITHVIIAEKKEGDSGISLDSRVDKTQSYSQEHIQIFSLIDAQKKWIERERVKMEGCEFESDQEFTFQHGYFPKKN